MPALARGSPGSKSSLQVQRVECVLGGHPIKGKKEEKTKFELVIFCSVVSVYFCFTKKILIFVYNKMWISNTDTIKE